MSRPNRLIAADKVQLYLYTKTLWHQSPKVRSKELRRVKPQMSDHAADKSGACGQLLCAGNRPIFDWSITFLPPRTFAAPEQLEIP